MSKEFVKKNIELSLKLDEYLYKHPDLFAKIPRDAVIIITVKGDNSFNRNSASIAEKIKGKEQKFIEARKEGKDWVLQPLGV